MYTNAQYASVRTGCWQRSPGSNQRAHAQTWAAFSVAMKSLHIDRFLVEWVDSDSIQIFMCFIVFPEMIVSYLNCIRHPVPPCWVVKEHGQRRLGIVGRSWWTDGLTLRGPWGFGSTVGWMVIASWGELLMLLCFIPLRDTSVVKGGHFHHPTPTVPARANTYQECQHPTSSELEPRS